MPRSWHSCCQVADGCLFGSRFYPCPCDLTATEAASPGPRLNPAQAHHA